MYTLLYYGCTAGCIELDLYTVPNDVCIVQYILCLVSTVYLRYLGLYSVQDFCVLYHECCTFCYSSPSHPSGGGGQLLLTHKIDQEHYWGQVEVTYCRLGWGEAGGCIRKCLHCIWGIRWNTLYRTVTIYCILASVVIGKPHCCTLPVHKTSQ